MDDIEMSNPANRVRNKHFLKRGSIEKFNTASVKKSQLLSHRAVAIKERTSEPSPPKILTHKKKTKSIGISTDN